MYTTGRMIEKNDSPDQWAQNTDERRHKAIITKEVGVWCYSIDIKCFSFCLV
ncbi:hypothetical protein DPMN_189274 [Dreissena polymorpha]|uniref:Uncharacterized protein n=1 Tax=Dreissena polymorpha TaxID=45954 RepID=A0A9D4DTQ7_DREPO|nr:hypothetical protein DPMN_189114 [Dreissena polymorpha]KAH3754596.1 hypothetical protein DPMN_189274 [Dreissena polymorpha]